MTYGPVSLDGARNHTRAGGRTLHGPKAGSKTTDDTSNVIDASSRFAAMAAVAAPSAPVALAA